MPEAGWVCAWRAVRLCVPRETGGEKQGPQSAQGSTNASLFKTWRKSQDHRDACAAAKGRMSPGRGGSQWD